MFQHHLKSMENGRVEKKVRKGASSLPVICSCSNITWTEQQFLHCQGPDHQTVKQQQGSRSFHLVEYQFQRPLCMSSICVSMFEFGHRIFALKTCKYWPKCRHLSQGLCFAQVLVTFSSYKKGHICLLSQWHFVHLHQRERSIKQLQK